MNSFTRLGAAALMMTGLISMNANGETLENLYDFANNNLNLEVATPADWENPTMGVISGQEIREGDVVLTSVDGAKVNRMWRTNSGVQYLQVGGKITITADAGRAITNITFEVQNYKFFLESQEGNGSLDSENYVWTGNSTAITFDNENVSNEYNIQSLLLSMTVTTDDADENTYTPSNSEIVEAANIAEFKALPVGTIAKLMLNDTQVNAVDWATTYVEDKTGAIEFDNINVGLSNNDIMNGYIIVKRAEYSFDDHVRIQATNDDLTSNETFTITNNGTLIPKTITIAELLTDDNISRLVKINHVTITQSGRFYYANDNDDQVMIQDAMFVLPYDFEMPIEGEVVSVAGIFTWDGIRYKIIITSIDLESPTAIIDIINNTTNDNIWYNIHGMQFDVEPLQSGIYIHNGKWVLIK